MRRFAWIWFAGCGAWLLDAFVSARLHAWQRAELAVLVSLVFLAAGVFYATQRR